MRPALLFLPILTILIRPGLAQPIAEPVEAQPRNMHPLALKEEMIRDRFQRFEHRVLRLREQLADREPENAARLGRVLQRAGELGLADQLDQLVERLKDPAGLPTALDAQAGWLTDADRLLAILLERDSENMERREEIERLAEYKKKLSDLLQQEKGLRNATGQGSLAERMRGQLDQAIRGIIGMDAAVVHERFTEFVQQHPSLASHQIKFLDLLQNHISKYGSIEITNPLTVIEQIS